MLLLFSVAYV